MERNPFPLFFTLRRKPLAQLLPGKIGLDEWRDFCKWIETLPHSDLIATEGD